jgi:GTP-binding protein
MNKKLPYVTIIGRPNVGKSALFNKLADTKRALVFDECGITRDPLIDTSSWLGYTYQIIDTAGIFHTNKKQQNDITKQAIDKAIYFLENADIILFVIDGSIGYTQDDIHLFNISKKINVPIITVINKIDTKAAIEMAESLRQQLHNGPHVTISAAHSKSINELQNEIVHYLKDFNYTPVEDEKKYFHVSFLGKPNVGKSSIMNIVAKENISIVSPIAGTTRESISKVLDDECFTITLADTAGVRKKRTIEERIEELMVSNTIRTIESSHIVIMVLDASEEVHDQDVNLLMKAFHTYHKAVLVIWNKIDLLPEKTSINDIIKKKIDKYHFFFKNIPQIYFSAIDTNDGSIIIRELKKLWERYSQKFDARDIKTILNEAFYHTPLIKIRQKIQFQKLIVTKTAPPNITLISRQKALFGEAEINFMTNILRKKKDLLGVPIVFNIQ